MAVELGVSSIPVSDVSSHLRVARTSILTFSESSTARGAVTSGNHTPGLPSAKTLRPCTPLQTD